MNHTSSTFASDFNKTRWEEVVGASTTGVTTWNSEAEYVIDQQVKYNATNFDSFVLLVGDPSGTGSIDDVFLCRLGSTAKHGINQQQPAVGPLHSGSIFV